MIPQSPTASVESVPPAAALDALHRPPRYRHVVFAGDLDAPRRLAIDARLPAVARPCRTSTALAGDDALLVRRVLAHVELDPAAYREESLARRVPACLRFLRVPSARAALRRLDERPDLRDGAVGALLIGVTGFFRDRPVFHALVSQARGVFARGRPVRAWSVGCSDGAELYSLGIVLAELGLAAGNLLGTDCRPEAIERARAGVFDDAALADVPTALRDRHFVPRGRTWQASPALRDATCWWRADALVSTEPGAWDVILCRNVAIYLHEHAALALWARLRGALRRGGLLVVGRAERPPGLSLVAPCVYRRDG